MKYPQLRWRYQGEGLSPQWKRFGVRHREEAEANKLTCSGGGTLQRDVGKKIAIQRPIPQYDKETIRNYRYSNRAHNHLENDGRITFCHPKTNSV